MAIAELLDRLKAIESEEFDGIENDADNESVDSGDFASDEPELEQDPKPGKIRGGKFKAPKPIVKTKATAADKRAVADTLTMLIKLGGGAFAMRDPVCGGAIVDGADAVVNSLVPIVLRNPAMLAWFTGGSGVMDVIGILLAFQPIIGTIWGHHVSHSIGDDEGKGTPVDYSAFTAPTIGN